MRIECENKPNFVFAFDGPGVETNLEVTCTLNATWMPNKLVPGYCPDDSLDCNIPAFTKCEDRTVRCNEEFVIGMDKIMEPHPDNLGTITSGIAGDIFRISCTEPDHVMANGRFENSIDIVCSIPPDYSTNWKHQKWLEGFWKGVDLLRPCIDPNICYGDPPHLPSDGTVMNNATAGENALGTTIFYECSRKCRPHLIFDTLWLKN